MASGLGERCGKRALVKLWRLGLVAGATGALMAGCGSSSSSPGTTSAPAAATSTAAASGGSSSSAGSGSSGSATSGKPPQKPAPTSNILMGGSTYTGKPTKSGTVTLGWISDAAGKFGTYGPNMIKASQMMVALMNQDGGILGHPVRFVYADDQGDPSVAYQKAQSMVASDHVSAMFNGVLVDDTLSLLPLTTSYKIPFFAGGAGDISFVGKLQNGYNAMIDATAETEACGFAKFQATKHPQWKRVALFETQSEFGDEHGQYYTSCLAKYDPSAKIVIHKTYPTGTTDWQPYISSLTNAKPDVIISTTFGPDTVSFYKQYVAAGAPVPYATFMDLDTAKSLGNGIKKGLLYGFGRAFYPVVPTAKPWVQAFEQRYHTAPSDYALTQISAILAYKAAVEKAGTLDSSKVMAAYRCLDYYEPRGWINVRAINGQANAPEYIGLMTPDKKLGFPTMDPTDSATVYGGQVWRSDAELAQVVPKDHQGNPSACGG
jgi:ABC-type branched-subunit amino acid transport system substrate-binding protein